MPSRLPLAQRRPRGWLRLALRLPNWLYRLGLGWLLGERFLRLTHIGRRTGLRHQTVLEVLRHDRATDIYVVCSGWGPEAEWLRNIAYHPEVTVTVERRSRSARAELLAVDAGALELEAYARRHPFAFRTITRWLVGSSQVRTPDFYRELAWSMPVVALRVDPPRETTESRRPRHATWLRTRPIRSGRDEQKHRVPLLHASIDRRTGWQRCASA